MLVQSAEDSYQLGLQALNEGRRVEALAMFEAAIELDRKQGKSRPEARYLSFYGLCLALERNEIREALRFCREAVTLETYNPDIRCNLGRVLMRAGRRKEAFDTLSRGLHLESDHGGIIGTLKRLGIRRRPTIPFLSRQNPLNVFLGRLRHVA